MFVQVEYIEGIFVGSITYLIVLLEMTLLTLCMIYHNMILYYTILYYI